MSRAPLPDAVGVVALCERLEAGIWETWNDDLGEHELRSDPRVAADVIQSQAARIAELEAERDEARELLDKTRRRPARDGMGGKVGELLDNQAWIALSHVGSQLSDHFGNPDLMEEWQEAYADGAVQQGYFTPHRGVAAWISRFVIANSQARSLLSEEGADA